MADSNTTTYSFTLPEVGASADSWGTKLNANWDKVDDLLDGTTAVDGINLQTFKIGGTTVSATGSELNFVSGVTSNIQTQLDSMVEKAGDTMTGDLSLGDNVKATFGASDDLQIYHDGSNSYIKDSGTGDLYLQGSSAVQIEDASGTNMIYALSGDTVQLFHNGSNKLATTSTGVDVTGTVTADGLTVDGATTINQASDTNSYLTLDGASGAYLSLAATTGHISADSTLTLNTASSERMRIDSSGKVGIGTSSPSNALEVGGEGILRIRPTTDNSQGALYFNDIAGLNSYRSDIGIVDNGGLYFKTTGSVNTAPTERMRIDSAGNVGINTTAPSEKLQVQGGNLKVKNDQAGISELVLDNSAYNTTSAGFAIVAKNDSYSAPVGRITFGRTSGYNETSNSRYSYMGFSTTLAGNESERMRLDSSGNLLVGTTSGTDKVNISQGAGGTILSVHSQGTSGAYAVAFRNPNGTVGNITISGTTTTYNTSSDERLKENIQDTTHTVDINDIKVREFDWKVDGSHQRYGFIAQELETVYPEAVHSPENPEEMKSVDYSKLVPLLVKEIQTLKARIETLENK